MIKANVLFMFINKMLAIMTGIHKNPRQNSNH